MPRETQTLFEQSILITAAPTRVLAAFFDPAALSAGGRRRGPSRPLGRSASTRSSGNHREADDILGRLGGVFYGASMEYQPGRELVSARPGGSARYESDRPDVVPGTVRDGRPACRLRVRQTGFEDSPRWRSYYSVIDLGWQVSMAAFKQYPEIAEQRMSVALRHRHTRNDTDNEPLATCRGTPRWMRGGCRSKRHSAHEPL